MININTTTSDQSYELLKIIIDFFIGIIWPVTILIIVFSFKTEIKKLLHKAKKIELPGGFAFETIEQEIVEAKELSVEVQKERKPEIQKIINEATSSFETNANERMIELGLKPSPSGLDIDYYRKIANTDPRLALIGLRADLEIMLKNISIGFNISNKENDSVDKIISRLLDNGAITIRQYELINKLFKICNSAAHGTIITKSDALEILDIGEILVKDYVAWLYWGFK